MTVETIISKLGTTFNSIIALLFVIATAVFFWGVIQYIAKGGDDAARAKAKSLMTYGVIGLAVMAGAFGLVQILITYFVGGNVAAPTIPFIPVR